MASKRGPGRPKKPQSKLRSVTRRFRLTEAEERQVVQAARAAGLSFSDYVRTRILPPPRQ